jgi:ABC-type glycerol-3-phosphate transport system substrate-binding protein
MKKLTAFLAAAMLLSAVALTGCSQSAEEGSSTESAVSSAVESTAASEDVSSEVVSSEDASSEEESRDPESTTDDFTTVFAENPIDTDYEQQMAEAVTSQDMIAVSTTYAGLWEAEVAHAYDLLLQSGAPDIAEEEATWESTKDDQLQALYDTIGDDGSAALVSRASVTMNFYRDKAEELYRQLYQYNPDFTYLYSPY